MDFTINNNLRNAVREAKEEFEESTGNQFLTKRLNKIDLIATIVFPLFYITFVISYFKVYKAKF